MDEYKLQKYELNEQLQYILYEKTFNWSSRYKIKTSIYDYI